MLVALGSLLSKDPTLKVDVYILNGLTTSYRSRADTATLAASHPFAPINQYFSQAAIPLTTVAF